VIDPSAIVITCIKLAELASTLERDAMRFARGARQPGVRLRHNLRFMRSEMLKLITNTVEFDKHIREKRKLRKKPSARPRNTSGLLKGKKKIT